MRSATIVLLALGLFGMNLHAQDVANSDSIHIQSKVSSIDTNRIKLFALARQKHWAITMSDKNKNYAALVGISKNNHPHYYTTFNNIDAAATLNTTALWPGGVSGINLSGSSSQITNKLAIWDGGRILDTHVELIGRINRMDSSIYNGEGSEHATHVTGTMMATGINPEVKGMCYGLHGILTYDFEIGTDIDEISAEAPQLLLSNHSYGDICGWYNDPEWGWIFFGNNGDSVDYNFGYYDPQAASLDNTAYNSPYYLHVRAAGNNRDQNGPYIGEYYYYYDSTGTLQQNIRQADSISSNNGYEIIPTAGNAKNIITVGAVSGIPWGYSQPSDVVMSPFSSWGPTNDGRIKPDLVSDGINVQSCVADSNTAYAYMSGTSMASPSVTGSLLLLQEYYSTLHVDTFMRAATLKGLAIHTANEAGTSPGPDYQFGWGLMNTQAAAQVIKVANATKNASNSEDLILENVLNNGQTYTKTITATGSGSLKATISWTDPAGKVTVVDATHPPIAELVNDLDLRIVKNGVTYKPWVLSPSVPAAAATTGDNSLDNVEQVVVNSVSPGDVCTIQITHKGTLYNNAQAYSLIITQPGDTTLPLNILNFSATQSNGKVLLQWTTTNEVNAKSFEMETSTNATQWSTLTSIAANNISSENQYSYTDAQPAVGNNYYRIKVVDANGSYAYSAVQLVTIAAGADLFALSPNPASDIATISLNRSISQAQLVVYDVSGKVVLRKDVSILQGNTYPLDVTQLASGVYAVSVYTNEGIYTKKLLIKK